MKEVSLLSLANQNIIKDVEAGELRSFLDEFLLIPSWMLFLVPVRFIALALISLRSADVRS